MILHSSQLISRGFFDGTFTLDEYLALDEGVLLTYFQLWVKEKDPILADLSYRFVNRKLFQYIEFDLAKDYVKMKELELLFKKAGIDPEYYLVFDSSSDLPYDFYRPGEEGERIPIHLLTPTGEIRELSRESEIVEAISGKRRTDHKLYFPEDFLTEGREEKSIKKTNIRSVEIKEGAKLLEEHAKIIQFIGAADGITGRKKLQKMVYIAKKLQTIHIRKNTNFICMALIHKS